MATQVQNCQRGNVFLWFLIFGVFAIVTIVRFVRNKIDHPDVSYGDIYKDSSAAQHEGTDEQIDKAKKSEQPAAEEPEPQSKFNLVLKYLYEIETQMIPLLIPFALMLVLGATKAFSMVWFFIFFIIVLLLNGIKIHRFFFDIKPVWLLLENIYVILSLFWWINFWALYPAVDPYLLYERP